MTPSFWQIAIVLLLIVLLFGRGKISDLMGDVARGIKSFKKGMQDEDTVAAGRNESLERKADPAEASAETAKSKGRDAA